MQMVDAMPFWGGGSMKKLRLAVLALLLAGTAANAYAAQWVKLAWSNGETEWAMQATSPGEFWVKLKCDHRQEVGAHFYDEIVSLDKINCTTGLIRDIQETDYLHGTDTYSGGRGSREAFYGAPGTFGAALIKAVCGAK